MEELLTLHECKKQFNFCYKIVEQLKKEWLESDDQDYRHKCILASLKIEKRIKYYSDLIYKLNKESNEKSVKRDNEIIMLECPGFECRYGPVAIGTGIRFKDYVPGKLKCDRCGSTLRIQGVRNFDFELERILKEFKIDLEK